MRGKRASDYAVGEIVKLKENGTPVEYLVVHQGLPGMMYDASCDGCWVLRKDIAEKRQANGTAVNDYEKSTINAYLNGGWLNRFDEKTKAAIKQVKIPYRPGGGNGGSCSAGDKGLIAKGFLLSVDEVKFSMRLFPNNGGSSLKYFLNCQEKGADAKRVAYMNGTAANWLTRTPWLDDPGGDMIGLAFATVKENGDYWFDYPDDPCGIRPAHILHADTLFDSNDILKG